MNLRRAVSEAGAEYCSAERTSELSEAMSPLLRSVLSSNRDSSWSTDWSSELIEFTPIRAMAKTSSDQDGHAADDPAAETAQHRHGDPARRTAPSSHHPDVDGLIGNVAPGIERDAAR